MESPEEATVDSVGQSSPWSNMPANVQAVMPPWFDGKATLVADGNVYTISEEPDQPSQLEVPLMATEDSPDGLTQCFKVGNTRG